MNIIDIDIILKRLSLKFNKIFCDREFVCCVQEDLEVILKNRNRCCVVLFPLLGPNYLKAVQYQAKIFDLEVFTLGGDKISVLAVCDKKFLIKKLGDSEEQIMQNIDQECGAGSGLKKKRPERKLYIPPAQRKLPVDNGVEENSKQDRGSHTKIKKQGSSSRKRESLKTVKSSLSDFENIRILNEDISKNVVKNESFDIPDSYKFLCWKYAVLEKNKFNSTWSKSVHNFKHMCNSLEKSSIFDLQRNLITLYILFYDHVLWQPSFGILKDERERTLKVVPTSNLDLFTAEVESYERIPIIEIVFPTKMYSEILDNYDIYCDVDVLWCRQTEPCNLLSMCCSGYYYLLKEDSYESKSFEELVNDLVITENYNDIYDSEPENTSISIVYNNNNNNNNNNMVQNVKDLTINMTKKQDNYVENRSLFKSESHFQKNKINNSNCVNYFKNSINVSENLKKTRNELEEEKEIMRKTKENINRKTRPIIKYVDEADDTLKIGKNDINNWEDLFDDDGQLQEDLLKEIVHKVGENVTIVKAKEDYTDYFTKQVNIEELEHMVELYDFPATLGTHDLIHAFSEIQSDAMYVKWVDDTHAILVLGSSSQALKALSIQNALIKVRPMTAASKTSLSTAYRHELKPAMKRPPTNLQTARRLITTHLGTKTGISQERSAKERDDLKAAKELKKLVKKNEREAWEGTLKSSLN